MCESYSSTKESVNSVLEGTEEFADADSVGRKGCVLESEERSEQACLVIVSLGTMASARETKG